MWKENSQMPGALIMCFAGRDQHMQVHHRECCHKFNEQRSQEFIFCLFWQRTIFTMRPPYDCQLTLPVTVTLESAHRTTPRMSPADGLICEACHRRSHGQV
jgi:hypothetical protein